MGASLTFTILIFLLYAMGHPKLFSDQTLAIHSTYACEKLEAMITMTVKCCLMSDWPAVQLILAWLRCTWDYWLWHLDKIWKWRWILYRALQNIPPRDFAGALWIFKIYQCYLNVAFCRWRSSPNRAYQMPLYAMINITYGERKDMHRVHQPNTPCHAGQGPWKTNTDQLDRRTFGHQQKECHPMSQSAANFPIPQILSRPVQVSC